MKSQTTLAMVLGAVLSLAACGGGGGTTGASGGTSGSSGGGGTTGGAGGHASGGTGGSPGRGGTTSSGGGMTGGGGTTAPGGTTGSGGTPGSGGTTASGGATGSGGAPGAGGGLGPYPGLAAGPVSDGATITFPMIGAAGMYPTRRDPAVGPCDVQKTTDSKGNVTCCLTNKVITGTQLTPWDEELAVSLRGPMLVKQFAVYQPVSGLTGTWKLASSWDARSPTAATNMTFSGGPMTPGTTGLTGVVGNDCFVDVSSGMAFPCGPGSDPYCPAPGAGKSKDYGWSGSKMFIILATMPHYGSGAITNAQNCKNDATDGWYDAPWIGISHGELVRQGLYNSCQCYSYPPVPPATANYSGDGCGQLNAFEVVNDKNTSKNLDIISTNFFGYGGYVGEGPCGTKCDVSALPASVDLVNKKTGNTEAAAGAVVNKTSVGAAFRRPATGYRYFIALYDVASRTVQLALVHPDAVPASIATLLPGLPSQVPQSTIDAMLALRLPH
ncbi:MAG TPA: DUF2403 domain-containing protein [Polyangia bacterium]|nr:DUF2403 domain-containing protein [Polyangia bacterium]